MSLNFSYSNRQPSCSDAGYQLDRQRELRQLFLDRLTRIVRKVHLHGRYLVPTDRRMQLLNRAILSTYCDCRELGIEAEARDILADLRRDMILPVSAPENLPF